MMLSKDIIVIPFLLGAFVTKNETEWEYDSVYIFELTKNIKIFNGQVAFENVHPTIFENVSATIKCHPKVSLENSDNVLVCDARKIYFTLRKKNETQNDDLHAEVAENKHMADQWFELEFSKQGVKKFNVQSRIPKRPVLDVVPDIVEQINIGIDLINIKVGDSIRNCNKTAKEEHSCSFMQTNENTTRASKCNTTFIITYTSSNTFHQEKKYQNNMKPGFLLKFLPLSDTNFTDATLTINRVRIACAEGPENSKYAYKNWRINEMKVYYNIMNISNQSPKFTSSTYFMGHILINDTNYIFYEEVHLKLSRILSTRESFDGDDYQYDNCETRVLGQINNCAAT